MQTTLIILLSNNIIDLQTQFYMAWSAMRFTQGNQLNGNPIEVTSYSPGNVRVTNSASPDPVIEDHISFAQRTAYSLMGPAFTVIKESLHSIRSASTWRTSHPDWLSESSSCFHYGLPRRLYFCGVVYHPCVSWTVSWTVAWLPYISRLARINNTHLRSLIQLSAEHL